MPSVTLLLPPSISRISASIWSNTNLKAKLSNKKLMSLKIELSGLVIFSADNASFSYFMTLYSFDYTPLLPISPDSWHLDLFPTIPYYQVNDYSQLRFRIAWLGFQIPRLN